MNLDHNTAGNYRSALSSVLTSAIRLGDGLTYNPARLIKLPPKDPEPEYLMPTPEAAMAILDGLKDPRHKMAWQAVMWLGNRCGEVRGLRWSSIEWGHGAIFIRESVWEGQSNPPKTKKGYRKILLTDEQMEILRKYKQENFPDAQPRDWVFPGGRGRPMDMRWFMRRYIRPLAEKLGMPWIHWHALRHLNNSMMREEGVDAKTRMDRLGHVSEGVNMIYTHVADEAQRTASAVIWQKLQKAAQNKPVSLKVAGEVAQRSPEEAKNELSY